MTVREKMKERLVENGLWPKEADAVIENAEYDKSLDAMVSRWDETVEGYPSQLLATIWASIKLFAIEWIDKNKPMHFAKLILSNPNL